MCHKMRSCSTLGLTFGGQHPAKDAKAEVKFKGDHGITCEGTRVSHSVLQAKNGAARGRLTKDVLVPPSSRVSVRGLSLYL